MWHDAAYFVDAIAERYRLPALCNTLHIKILTAPTTSIEQMLSSMRRVYQTAGIGVQVATRETLNRTALATLDNLDVGGCVSSPSAEQTSLYLNQNNVGSTDLVAYFVQSVTQTSPTSKVLNGCATLSKGAVSVAQIASVWTLAHEIGHALGLSHISGEKDAMGNCVSQDTTRLMTGCSTSNIIGTPTVSASEIKTMTSSSRTLKC